MRIEIGIRNHKDGVKLCIVRKEGAAYACGLRKGDVVTHINSIPLTHHVQAVRLIDAGSQLNYPLYCTLKPPKKVFHRLYVIIKQVFGVRKETLISSENSV